MGTKLMLLAMLPVCCLLVVAVLAMVNDWRGAERLRDFRAATRVSFATAQVADDLARERIAAVLARLDPGPSTNAQLIAAQRTTTGDLRAADGRAAGKSLPVDVTGRLDAVRRQRQALLFQTATGSLDAPQIAVAYASLADELVDTARDLDAGRPTRASGRAADAYLAILRAVEAAARERVDVAALLAPRGARPRPTSSRWETLESGEFDAFRQNAAGPLVADLQALLFSPIGMHVQQLRDQLRTDPPAAVRRISLADWMSSTGARLAGLRSIEHGARSTLGAAVSHGLDSASGRAYRDLGLSLGLVVSVAALAFALRRSITRPLGEVAAGARALSSGDLNIDIRYAGRDEIGDVAAAFRDLHVTTERLAQELRAMNTAIRDNRLDHRSDLSAFEGAWAQLLGGMNDTMATFAELHGRRLRAERETEQIFEMSLDLLCIAGFDGHFKRVNPAFERTLEYPTEALLSRPMEDFVHPDDRESARRRVEAMRAGEKLATFESRYIRSDGSTCWIGWNARPVPEAGVIYAAGRDVTESRRAAEEHAALRRLATLVARGVPPAEIFDAVVSATRRVLDVDGSALMRLEGDGNATITAVDSTLPLPYALGERLALKDEGVVGRVMRTGKPARLEPFEVEAGPASERVRALGLRGAAAAPVVVEGRLWGVMAVGWASPRAMPAGSEDRLVQFTDLIATAIANAQSRAELEASRAQSRSVAAEQSALRRVATLVAQGVPADEIFEAVVRETRSVLDVDVSSLLRLESDGTTTLIAFDGSISPPGRVGQRMMLTPGGTTARVLATGRPARTESPVYEQATGALAEQAQAMGFPSTVGAPIVANGRLWGVIVVLWAKGREIPPGGEERLVQFSELIATAIANAQSRAELEASRARVVDAGDEARRRIERDLHDGVQQQLVVLGLQLRAAQELAATAPEELREHLSQVSQGLSGALDDLREVSLGIHPAILRHGGLRQAIQALARRSPVPVEVDLPQDLQLPKRVQVCAYYVISEALTNVAKHGQASAAEIHTTMRHGLLELLIRDDGVGGATSRGGSGLIGLADRVEALGGRIRIASPPGGGTTLRVTLPCDPASNSPAFDHAA